MVLTDWIIFAFIVVVVAVDDVLHELRWSISTTRAFVLDRLRWIVVERVRRLWRASRR